MERSNVGCATRWMALGLASMLGCAPQLPESETGVAYDPSAGSGNSGGNESCSTPADDDMELGGVVSLPGSVRRIVAAGDGVLACGDTFAAWLDGGGAVQGVIDLVSPCVAAAALPGEVAIVLTADGDLTALSTAGGLSVLQSASLEGAPTGLAVLGEAVFVAAGSGGVLRVDATSLEINSTFQVSGALDVAASDGGLLVAAGSGGVLLLDPDSGEVRSSFATESPAWGIRASGNEAVVLRGAQGWDWLDVGETLSSPGPITTEGVVIDALLSNGNAFVVEGHAVLRYGRDGGTITRLSSEHRPDVGRIDGGWLRSISAVGDGYAVAGDAGVFEFIVRAPEAVPDLSVDAPSLQVFAGPGESIEALYVVRNTGGSPLRIIEVDTDGPFTATLDTDNLDSSSCDGQFELAPGASTPISLVFDSGEGAMTVGALFIESNDPDQPTLEVVLEGNPTGPSPGLVAPDFTGLTLAGDPFRLSDHAGKVIFMKLFDFGCSTCSEEFPLIQQDLVPIYGDDVVFVGINKGRRTAYADSLSADAGLDFPVVLDMDSQAFARYRIPSKVFPLHVIVDADGTIVLADTEPGLALVESTLASLVGG